MTIHDPLAPATTGAQGTAVSGARAADLAQPSPFDVIARAADAVRAELNRAPLARVVCMCPRCRPVPLSSVHGQKIVATAADREVHRVD